MKKKPSFKQTEVGIIPKEWSVKCLGDCLDNHPSYGINAAAVSYSDKLPTYIRITDISKDGRFLPDQRASVNSIMSSKFYLEEGDIVFARTGASVGKSYRYNPKDGPLVYAGFLICVKPNKKKIIPAFLSTYVTMSSYWRWVSLMSMRSGQPGINGKEYAQLPIPFPELHEQQAIVKVISDIDLLVVALDQLISKKRNIRYAVMQQLLTGKIRLPGFNKEWKIKTLNQIISRFSTGLNPRKNFRLNSGGNFYYVTIKNFTTGRLLLNEKCDLIDKTAFLKINERSDLRKDDILFSSIGRIGDAYLITDNPQNWNINESVFTLRPDKKQIIPLMLFHLLRNTNIKDALNQGSTGSTFKSIKQAQLKKILCYIPSSQKEQIAIAEALSEMDNELTLLEKRHNKIKSLKQAMMQELLTGKTRLV